MTKKPQSICILRLSAIGDVTHILPVVTTLQKAYPNVSIRIHANERFAWGKFRSF